MIYVQDVVNYSHN